MISFTPTVCPYCGAGCGILLMTRNGEIVGTRPWSEHPVCQGKLCIKGWNAHEFIYHPDRLKKPLLREGDSFKEIGWEQAINTIAEKLTAIKNQNGPDSLAFLASAKCTNEDNYLFQKFVRTVIGTNNIDHCARLCHASTVTGLGAAFGSGAMTNSIADVIQARTIFIIGSDTMSQHPLGARRILMGKERGAKIILADPRRIQVTRFADIYLRLKPGTDAALLNGIMKYIIDNKLEDADFIAERTEGFEQLKEGLSNVSLDEVAKITGVPRVQIEQAARLYATEKPGCIIYAMGITQHVTGTDNVLAIANLAMLTGNIGQPGTGVDPLRGQNNVQGACDMGALPDLLPGYRPVTDEAKRNKVAEVWGVTELPASTGLTIIEMMNAATTGKVKAMFIMGENPMVSDPDTTHVEEALNHLEFLVVQDIFPTETTRLADIILPAASWAERDGTFTGTDRRVQLIRKVIEPLGECKPDWEIICELAKAMQAGDKFTFTSTAEIFAELRQVTPQYAGISHTRLEQAAGLQWPCPEEGHPGTPILHIKQFTCGKGKFSPITYKPPAENPDAQFPFILTTGRTMSQYHTRSMTGRSPSLNAETPEAYVEINPDDAKKLKISDNSWVEVSSRRGAIKTRAKITDRVAPGIIFMPFHFAEAAVNRLTGTALDPVAKIPELKVCAAAVKPVVTTATAAKVSQ